MAPASPLRSRSAPRLAGLLAGGLLAAFSALAAPGPGPAERGFPLIRTYEPAIPEAGSQSFGIAADPRGVLYVASGGGVLVHDGAWWRGIPIGKERAAFAVESDAAGRVAAGGIDELGVLTADAGGSLRFVSLLHLLPPGQRRFGQVLEIHAVPGGFAFLTPSWLAVWDGVRMTTVATFPGDLPLTDAFEVGSEVYLWTREGIVRLAGTKLEPVPGGEGFRRRVDALLPADGGLLVSVRGEGLFLLKEGEATPFAPEASRWTAEKRLLEGLRLADGRWALGSLLGGVLLLRPDGAVDQVIDTAVGLPDDFVSDLAVDREGALWLALNNGLARVEVASPLSVVDRRTGLQGTVYSVTRHQGRLWVGTAAGLFTTAEEAGRDAEWGHPIRMRPAPGLALTTWSLTSRGEDLLVGTAFGLYQLRAGRVRFVPGTEEHVIYVLAPSRRDADRVWIGTESGLASARREGDGWRFEGMVAGVSNEVRTIAEGEKAVWCGGRLDAVAGVELATGRVRRVAGSEGGDVFRIGGRLLVAQTDRVLRLDEGLGRLVATELAGLGEFSGPASLAEDAAGNLWMNTRPPSVAIRRGDGWGRRVRTLHEVPGRGVILLYPEPDGTVWMASDKGLLRYGGTFRGESAALPAPLFGRITTGGDALAFGGAPGAAPRVRELPADVRRLRIELAPLSFRAGLGYQTRLDPVDAGWSAPAAEPFAELTRLPPGRYTFRARTVGPSLEEGPEAAWSFRVLPPWYRTPWALALWLALAVLLVSFLTGLRSQALRQRAARLEARVAEQTVELRATVEELRRAQAGLEAANARLEELSLQDELTGIANRRRLQQALHEEWSRALRHERPVAFILLDLDYFKLLNDTRGHAEGDACLEAVAGFLDESARRTGDLAARYGGEEFAVLLPETDLAGALDMAEQLREGIEALALPHAAAPLGRITASLGVAALTPAPGQKPETLIEAADLALYQAKTEGRNRVAVGASALTS